MPWLANCGNVRPGAADMPLVFDTASLQKVRPGRTKKCNPKCRYTCDCLTDTFGLTKHQSTVFAGVLMLITRLSLLVIK